MKYDLIHMDVIEIYKLVLNKEIKKFPNGFWMQPEAKDNSIKCFKYMIENILKWNIEDIKNKLTRNTFSDNKLCGMFQTVYKYNKYDLVEATYPGKIQPWEFQQLEPGYWTKETSIHAIKYTIENMLHWNDEDIKNNFKKEFFEKNRLHGAYIYFKKSVYNTLNAVYPDKFQPWHLSNCPNGYWNKKTASYAIRYEIDKMKWSNEDIKQKINYKFLKERNLTTAITYFDSLYDAIKIIYKNELKDLQPWELNCCPQSYWMNNKNILNALKWLSKKININNVEELEKELIFYGLVSIRNYKTINEIKDILKEMN